MERREVACSGGGGVSLLSCSNSSSSSSREDRSYHCVYFQKDSIKRRIEIFC